MQKTGKNRVGRVGSVKERFDRKYEAVTESDCWLWTSSIDLKGYGQFMIEPGQLPRAHRFSWELHRGSPGRFCVLHKCDVRSCVNPNHLFLGTIDDNNKDMGRKQRARNNPHKAMEDRTNRELLAYVRSRENGVKNWRR